MAYAMERVEPIKLERTQFNSLLLCLMVVFGFATGFGLVFLSWHFFPALEAKSSEGFVGLLDVVCVLGLSLIAGYICKKKVTIIIDSKNRE